MAYSNQSQRYSAVAANGSTRPHENGNEPRRDSAESNRPRIRDAPSRTRLSLSVAGPDRDGLSGQIQSADYTRSVHPLRSTWVFWYRQQRGGKVVNYEEGIKKIAPFGSIEGFWSLWTHLSPPSTLQPTTDFILFLSDVIRPVWEDPLNKDGGKWILRLKKGVADRLWEDLVVALVGEQFEEEDHVCGCVLSVRSNEDIMSVWHRDESDTNAKARIRDTIVKCLQLSPATTLEYKTNNASLHDKSSFRTPTAEKASA